MRIPPREQLQEIVCGIPAVELVLAVLSDADREAGRIALVGGAVRDLLLGRGSVDIDLVVEGPLSVLASLLDEQSQSYDRFSTLTLETEAGRIDVAQARRERYSHPGALPEVVPATIEEDLERRDFTVNSLAVPLIGRGAGSLVAHASALSDLEHRRLAVLHDRSFIDDPTRLLRLARYRSRLGFDVAPHTLQLARTAVASGALLTVSGQRIGAELRLLAGEPEPLAALSALSETGADSAIDPGFGIGAPDDALAATLGTALSALPPDGRRDLLALAGACRGVLAESLWDLLERLGFPAAERDMILGAATDADALAARLGRVVRPSEIADAVGSAAVETVALAEAIGEDEAASNARRWISELRHIRPAITGDDLLAEAIPPGPALGAGLAAARSALLDGDAPDRESQLRVALAAARAAGRLTGSDRAG